MKVSRTHILSLQEQKLLNVQTHNRLPLWILNYSKEAQYQNFPDPFLLEARGMVVEDDGNEDMEVVAIPFKKIRNYEELTSLPDEPYEIYTKMDGSLGIVFNYEGEVFIATRGSFHSDQAIKAKEIWNRKYSGYDFGGFTLLFEIIYPQNRIVVDYQGEENLVLLAAINNNMNVEVPRSTLKFLAQRIGFDLVNQHHYFNPAIPYLKGRIGDNEEGYVLKFQSGLRVKIKGKEYCRLHRIVTGVSNKTIFEYVSKNKPLSELIERVPDEFFSWVDETVNGLKMRYNELYRYAQITTEKIIEELGMRGYEITKKDFALEAILQPFSGLLFERLAGGNRLESMIWRIIEKELEFEKPFSHAKVTDISGD